MEIQKLFKFNGTNRRIKKDNLQTAPQNRIKNDNAPVDICAASDYKSSISNNKRNQFNNVNETILRKIEDREIYDLKNAENKEYSTEDIIYFASVDNQAWSKVESRNLIKAHNAENKAFLTYETIVLARINDTTWRNIEKRKILTESKGLGKGLSAWDIKFLGQLSDEAYEKTIKEYKKIEYADKPAFFVYETIMGNHPETVRTAARNGNIYRSSLFSLSGDNYEENNKKLYGEKLPEVERIYQEFKEQYPDIELTFDNDVSYERAKKILNATKLFIETQKAGNAPIAKKIQFTKLDGASGFYKYQYRDKIWVNIQGGTKNYTCSLTHENGHFKDFIEDNLALQDIPYDVKPILRKVFGNYAATQSYESIAELAKAIETPYDWDNTKMTRKIRLREDSDGNLVLMIMKNNNVSEEETEKLGKFFRDIRCPKLIPDYKEYKHGPTSQYHETIIRREKIKPSV